MTPALIGRDHPMGVLRAEIARTADSHGGLALVTGEAGIGKTALVTRAAHEARRRGALVVGGSCWDSDSAPGYWPWVQVLRGLRRGVGEERWAEIESAAGGQLAVLLGEPPSPAGPPAPDRDGDQDRVGDRDGDGDGDQDQGRDPGREDAFAPDREDAFALYDAVTTALVTASQDRPVVVVLDDLHRADSASLQLLEFAAQHAWFERLLLVGAYRDVEVEAADHPLQRLILPLVARATTTVTLTGLGRDDVGALLALTAGREPDAAVMDEVHLRTGGNPFFVEQTARLWCSGSPLSAVAPGVREAVRSRLAQLPPPVYALLTSAAVLGREFHRGVLAGVAAEPLPRVDRLLERAVAARVVVGARSGRFAFAHDLVREALYESLPEPDVRRRHAAVVRALDADPALNARLLPAELARHAYLAGAALERDRRLDLLLAAARDASSRLAGEETLGHYRRALRIAEGSAEGSTEPVPEPEPVPARARANADGPDRGESEPGEPGDPRRAVLIALDLGGELRNYGEEEEAWRYFERAALPARELRDAALLARVAITLHRRGGVPGHEAQTARLLREAHRTLIGGEADPRQLDPAQLAQELTVRSTALARRGEDDDALAFSLWARHDTIWGLGTAAERLVLTDEMAAIARRTGDRDMEVHATAMRWVTLLEQGDPRFHAELRAYVTLAERTGKRRFELGRAIDLSMAASLAGRFDEAEELLAEALEPWRDHAPYGFISAHLDWALKLLRGRFDAADAVAGALAGLGHPYPRLPAALTALERGDTASAVRYLRETEAGADPPFPRVFAPLWLRFRAQTAAASGDEALIDRARAALAPYAGQWMVSLYGCDISGPVDLWLGVLAAASGRADEAVMSLTAARDAADRLGATPWSQRAATALTAALRDRDGSRFSSPTATDAPAPAPVSTEPPAPPPAPVPAARVPSPRAEFRRDGTVWALAFAGRAIHVPDAKGLRDLHTLLGHPGTDLPAGELLAPEGGRVVAAARALGGDAVLDETAKAAYKRRLAELDEEIDGASVRGDTDRAAEGERERRALLDELRRAAGLGGRTRRLGDEAERARKTVTARIRDTLRKLDTLHPELAAHLRASVSTGTTCAYRTDPATPPLTWHL
ncbi:ATP-binding protein [Streptomyces sp. NPDC056987]|uniref:ATP-binding protein n=1 Tax=Streptomyces sp. NPDC056987 TaxID=3345988 RepID=UPI0036414369